MPSQTTGSFTFKELDPANESELGAYEKAIYRAVAGTTELDGVCVIDRASKRIRLKIPYETQKTFLVKLGGRVVAGMAANMATEGLLQLEMEGFRIDKAGNDFCEVLFLFCSMDWKHSATILESLSGMMLHYLMSRKIKRVYATCSARKVRPYQALGFRIIDERMWDDERVFLLEARMNAGAWGTNSIEQALAGRSC